MRFLLLPQMSPAAIARIAAHSMPIYNVELEDLSRPSFSNWGLFAIEGPQGYAVLQFHTCNSTDRSALYFYLILIIRLLAKRWTCFCRVCRRKDEP